MATRTHTTSKVNVTAEGPAIVVEPVGALDERAARIVWELVSSARRASVPVVVDLGRLDPGTDVALTLAPVIARGATVRRWPRA